MLCFGPSFIAQINALNLHTKYLEVVKIAFPSTNVVNGVR